MLNRFLDITAAVAIAATVAVTAPAGAVPLHYVDYGSKGAQQAWATEGMDSAGKEATALYSRSITGRPQGLGHTNSDPCGPSRGWLTQQSDGVILCHTLADYYAPQITAHPPNRTADIGSRSGLALFILGLGVLGLATRRPVWLTRLMG